ncbi:3-oxoacyl-[acyl-carrier-protein] reductase [Granulicatella elegans]|uniref:3-oxoacyl-[acyl-carrier-protein] reductase n=1 Tax=Granulicatella elegans TaxID=137732 RepID=UPI0028D53C49|nr:3-oxoacyl-[acyl-carrier-protein] reductase [Granulicatella elegans]
MKFIDKTVVVTGSRRGIGLGIALAFAKEGANIVLNATSEISQEVLELFSPYPGEVLTVVGDISKFEVAESLVEQTIEKFSKIDVLVNNAGITRDGLVLKMKEQDFDDVIDINLKGCFNLIRLASPCMVRQKSGSIINMTSIVGVSGNAGQVNYAASKAGIIGLTKSVAKEIGSRGITVNAIAPGYIDTEMTQALPEKIRKEWEKQIPMRKFGTVEDIAEACLYLAEQKYMTGQVLQINGGLYM